MLASLIVLSSLFYLALAAWLPLLRRIITPVVSGTVLMLIAALILPIAFDRLQEVPEGSSLAAGPCVAAVTLVAATMLMLRGSRTWRPWSLLLGIAAGCVAAAPFGLYDFARLSTASWVGIPASGFPGPGPDAERGILGTAADVPDCHPRASDQGHWRRRGRSTGVAAAATNDRLSPDPRLNLRQRGERSIIGHCRNAAHDLLFVFYCLTHQPHRSLRPQRRICRGGAPRGAGVLSQDNERPTLHSQPSHGGFLVIALGDALRRGDPDPRAGRPRPAKGHRSRTGVLHRPRHGTSQRSRGPAG